MKKILLMLLLFCTSSFAKSNPGQFKLEPKAGIGVGFGVDSDDVEIEAFTILGLETYYSVTPKIDLGLGMLFTKGAASKIINSETSKTDDIIKIPVYLEAKINLFPHWAINPYTKVIYGYQFVLDNDIIGKNQGKYIATAWGFDINEFTAETFISLEGHYTNEENYRGAMGYGFTLGYIF